MAERKSNGLRRFAILAAVLALSSTGGYFTYKWLIGWPATPMTVDRLDRMIRKGVQVDQSRDEVEKWLAHSSIAQKSDFTSRATHYRVVKRSGEEFSPIRGGNPRIVEADGVKENDVQSMIWVRYPEADRYFMGMTKIDLFLLFDERERFLGHRIVEFYMGL